MAITEHHWIGHDNTIDLILKEDGTAVDTSSFTQILLTLDSQNITSTNQVGDPVLWGGDGYATGEIRIDLNGETVNAGKHQCAIVITDAANANGIVWAFDDDLIIHAHNDPEV